MSDSATLDMQGLGAEFLKRVRAAKTVVVGSHLNPDGDAIGSALSMSFVLSQLGIDHDVLFHHAPPANLIFLPGVDRIKHQAREGQYDLALVLDLEALDRLGSNKDAFTGAKSMIVIDHHVPTESPGDFRIVSTSYPATCSILTDLFQAIDINVTPDIAELLITGILTDTGNFRYPNTTAKSLHQVAWLVELGADISKVSDEVYMRRTLASSRLNGYALTQMKLALDGRVAYTSIPYAEFVRVNGNEDDTEGFVSELLGIQGIDAAFLLRESKPGVIRGSLRSRDEIDVASAAREFGGGGHRNAAGVSFTGDLAEAEAKVLEAIGRVLS